MFRICRVAGIVTKVGRPSVLAASGNKFGVQNAVCLQRLYASKQCDDKPPNKQKKVDRKVTGGTLVRDCRPGESTPCKPPPKPPICHQNIPYLDECKPPQKVKLPCPPPECPYEEDENEKRRYYRNLILGVLFTAAALGALYYLSQPKSEVESTKKKKRKAKKKFNVILKNPTRSSDIPNNVPYLLIGGGTASFSAFRAIKSADPTAKVLVIANENYLPYMRPPLSKEMWFNDEPKLVKELIFKQWNGSERSLFYEPEDFYIPCTELMAAENGGVAVARGWNVKRLDVENRKAYLEDDYEIEYGKCLIATGAQPRTLEVFEVAAQDPKVDERVTFYRNVFDFEDLLERVETAKSVAIVGGGFLGSELACALARKKRGEFKVYQVFRESGNMGKILPEYLSFWTTNKVKEEGVQVISNNEVLAVDVKDNHIEMTLKENHVVRVDHVVVAVGAVPNTDLAEESELEVHPELGGFVVNAELQARSNLFAAGDCACFYDVVFGRRRIEHHDNAVISGRLAGENMTGAQRPYRHQSMFWSDLGPDVGYEAIGIVDSSLPTVGVFAKATDKDSPKAVVTATDEGLRSKTEEIPQECKKYVTEDPEAAKDTLEKRQAESQSDDFGKGIVFYLQNDIVVGVVLWNVFNRMSVARQVLKDRRKYEDLNEVAKLFNIHEE